jgi:putative acetyltransferase
MIVRPERPDDFRAIEALLDTAFGQPAESRLVDALRQGDFTRLALVAESQGEIVGYLLFSDLPIETPGGTVPALALAPMAVWPGVQRQGVGSRLVREGLRQALDEGHRIVIVLGHRHYYPRFGFSAELARPLASPYAGESFMALELVAGALTGVAGEVRYPPPFSAF